MKRFLLILLALIFGFGADANAAAPLRVVTSFSILADITKNVGGNAVAVTSLVGPDMDAHTYQPTPEDAEILAHADLIIINGLGFEGWIERLIEASGARAKIVTVTDGMEPRIIKSLKGVPDPHAWQNLGNGKLYARIIADALEQALPEYAATIRQNDMGYEGNLDQMDRYIRAQFAQVPPAQRKVITSHDSFAYFAAAYGVTFLSPVGINTEAEPSASDVAKLMQQIRAEGVQRIFIENMSNSRLIRQIAADSHVQIGGTLYSDALSAPGGPASTYIGMFRNNVPMLKTAMLLNKP